MPVTFRDFAGALMKNDDGAAAQVLVQLLAIDPPAATAATAHFRARMSADPSFMQKAMGLRAAVESGNDAQTAALLVDCFDLADPADAVAALRSSRAP